MNKKIIALAVALIAAITVVAGPHGGPGGGHHGGGFHHGGWHNYGGAHHSGSFWGHGGRNFWPGFVGGVVGGMVGGVVSRPVMYNTPVVTTPVVTTPVYTQPVVQQQPVIVNNNQYVYRDPIHDARPVSVGASVVQSGNTTSVYVNGYYTNQVQPNGVVLRVWVPGHWEYR